mgnify:CR=1 FL=1
MQLKSAFITLCSAALTFSLLISEPLKAQTNFTLPDLGTSALQALPLEKEQAIGEVMMMQIRGSSPVINDPVLDEYLTTIGRKLVAEVVNIDVNLLSYLASGNKQEALKYWLTKENLTKSDVALHALFKGEVEIENIITEIGDLTSTYNIRKELNINHPSQIYV